METGKNIQIFRPCGHTDTYANIKEKKLCLQCNQPLKMDGIPDTGNDFINRCLVLEDSLKCIEDYITFRIEIDDEDNIYFVMKCNLKKNYNIILKTVEDIKRFDKNFKEFEKFLPDIFAGKKSPLKFLSDHKYRLKYYNGESVNIPSILNKNVKRFGEFYRLITPIGAVIAFIIFAVI